MLQRQLLFFLDFSLNYYCRLFAPQVQSYDFFKKEIFLPHVPSCLLVQFSKYLFYSCDNPRQYCIKRCINNNGQHIHTQSRVTRIICIGSSMLHELLTCSVLSTCEKNIIFRILLGKKQIKFKTIQFNICPFCWMSFMCAHAVIESQVTRKRGISNPSSSNKKSQVKTETRIIPKSQFFFACFGISER